LVNDHGVSARLLIVGRFIRSSERDAAASGAEWAAISGFLESAANVSPPCLAGYGGAEYSTTSRPADERRITGITATEKS
jgi:hypothetical protein